MHYINHIDYAQMATKAVRRCDLLAQVLVGRVCRTGPIARAMGP
jgi:hypothetical protein